MLKLGLLDGFTDSEVVQLNHDLAECNRALADPGFKTLILGCAFENTEDTNEQIWAKISADGVLSKETILNLGWWATHYSHTIAEEDSEGEITCNRPLYDTETESSPARSNTQFHEWCHVAGYSHRSPRDYLSVPYQAGNKMELWLLANPVTQ